MRRSSIVVVAMTLLCFGVVLAYLRDLGVFVRDSKADLPPDIICVYPVITPPPPLSTGVVRAFKGSAVEIGLAEGSPIPKVGAEFNIFRGSTFITKIKIRSVSPTIRGSVLYHVEDRQPRTGDFVTTSISVPAP